MSTKTQTFTLPFYFLTMLQNSCKSQNRVRADAVCGPRLILSGLFSLAALEGGIGSVLVLSEG
jgi:hypothetical protein